MGLWEVGEVSNEGVLLRQDMSSSCKIEVVDGVVVVSAIGEEAGGSVDCEF